MKQVDASELERALTAAIKASVEARTLLYAASYHADRAVIDYGNRGEQLRSLVAAQRDGQLMACAATMESVLSQLRRMRREVRR